MSELYGKYGLPLEVKFCKKCTMNNQRPSSTVEFRQKEGEKKRTLFLVMMGSVKHVNMLKKEAY